MAIEFGNDLLTQTLKIQFLEQNINKLNKNF